MPRKLSNALTARTVATAKPGRYADGGGLYLLVKPSGARSWVLRYFVAGVQREMGLGAADGPEAVKLATARDMAAAQRLQIASGADPVVERSQKAAAARAASKADAIAGISFRSVAETYISTNETQWRNDKHRQQWRNTLASYVYPLIGDLPVRSIVTAHVLQILEPIWNEKPETASRVRGRIETILDAAKAREYREGENPARWRGHIAQLLPARTRLTRGHHPSLPYEQLGGFMAKLRTREAMAAYALEFAILTAARTGEVLGATWAEVDLDKALWTIPAARMKTAKEHRVPLSERAVEILKTLKPIGSKWLFPASRGGKLSSMAMSMLIRRMHETELTAGRAGFFDPRQDRMISTHGFRSSFRDWADERTAYPWEMKEMALAHTISNKSEAAYRRGDLFEKRRRMMDDWAEYCASENSGEGVVTPIRRLKVN